MTTALEPLGSLAGLTCDITADLRGAHDDLHALRTLLVADVARRLIESFLDGQAAVSVNDASRYAAVQIAADALWIPPPQSSWGDPSAHVQAPGGANVKVAISHLASAWDGPLYPIGPVTSAPSAPGDLLEEPDPLDLRLALLRFQHGETAHLTKARLYRAQETLHRWRVKVAQWSHMPSARPLDLTPFLEPMRSDLDTPSTLTAMHHLETNHEIASGAKFETFLSLDRVLSLDLPHLIGKL